MVVGGGIAGLAAAHALRGTARVTVLESADRVGGKLRTEEFAGRPLDVGADMWRAVPEVVELARAVGLGDELVAPETTDAYLLVGRRLRRLRPSRVLSPLGLLRAGIEPVLPGRPVCGPASLGAVVGRRFGRQVVDRLVDPMVGGVYAGRADDLDLDTAAPALAAVARSRRSLWRARTAGRGSFLSLARGQGAFAAAVAAASGAEIRTRARAVALERVGQAWRVTLAGGSALVADAVVVAVPAGPAAGLLHLVAPGASGMLDRVRYASVAVVALAYPMDGWQAPRGSGYLVPASAGRLVKAVTFSSQKWAHHRDSVQVVRCSVGRAGEPPPPDDAALLAAVQAELAVVVGPARPLDALVAWWPDALPQYAVGHGALVDAVLDALPLGLAVAGAAYGGVGVPACIGSGLQAAARIMTP